MNIGTDSDQDPILNGNSERRALDYFIFVRRLNESYQGPLIVTIIFLIKVLASYLVIKNFDTRVQEKPILEWITIYLAISFAARLIHWYMWLNQYLQNNYQQILPYELEVQYANKIVLLQFIDRIFVAWQITGNFMFYTCRSCIDTVPELSYLMLSFLILGYVTILLPLIVIALICVFICFYICFQIFKARQRRREQIQRTEIQLQMMHPVKYQGEPCDCSICTETIDSKIDVIVMPCDSRHVFHEECIKGWLQQKPQCPICRASINDDQL